mgnify:CR=1 FL=1
MNDQTLAERLIIDCGKVSDIIVDFIRMKVIENGKDGVCLGISGGVDSATVAILSVKAMGDPSRVYGLHLFDRNSQRKFREHAQKLADELGINFERRDISKLVEKQGAYKPFLMRAISFSSILNRLTFNISKAVYPLFHRENTFILALRRGDLSKNRLNRIATIAKTVEEGFNIRHIERRRILENYAAEKNLLLVGAANRSESFVGWFVKDGIDDLPIEALLGLYKNQVYQLAKFLGVPEEILKEAPSPDMFKGIGDEDLIGHSYEKIDKVAYVLEHNLSEETASNEGITLQEFQEIKNLNQLSTWKRENKHQYPSFAAS